MKGVPVIEWTTLSEKNRFWAKKPQRNGFLEFSHFTARKHLAFLLFCSAYAQTYRIVAHFIFEGGKTKLSQKTVVNSYLPFQKFQGSAGVDFSLREILAHFSLSYFHCIASIALKLTIKSPI